MLFSGPGSIKRLSSCCVLSVVWTPHSHVCPVISSGHRQKVVSCAAGPEAEPCWHQLTGDSACCWLPARLPAFCFLHRISLFSAASLKVRPGLLTPEGVSSFDLYSNHRGPPLLPPHLISFHTGLELSSVALTSLQILSVLHVLINQVSFNFVHFHEETLPGAPVGAFYVLLGYQCYHQELSNSSGLN